MNADSGNVSKTDIKRINRLRRSNCHGLKLQANAKMQHDHQKDARLRLLSCSAILWIVEGFQINKTIATRQTQWRAKPWQLATRKPDLYIEHRNCNAKLPGTPDCTTYTWMIAQQHDLAQLAITRIHANTRSTIQSRF
jgi:hypothetical protein